MSAEVWSAVADWVVAIAAGIGALTAWTGLNAWQDQQKWTLDTQLAHRILVLIYRHKDALAGVRHPAIWTGETVDAVKGKELPDDRSHRRFIETASVYEKRWSKVSEIRAEIYSQLLEAQALWGDSFKDLLSPLWKLEVELLGVVRTYLDSMDPNSNEDMRRAVQEIHRKKRDILYDMLDETDEFRADYARQLIPIEATLRLKLGRK